MPTPTVWRSHVYPGSSEATGTALVGTVFVVSFVAAFALLGDLFGAFADPDQFFVDYYAENRHLIRDLMGGHLLVIAGLALLLFLHQFRRYLGNRGGAIGMLEAAQLCSVVGVAILLTGAGAITTVSYARTFGRLTGDVPLSSSAAALPPQLGYVLVFFPAMWALALAIGLLLWCSWSGELLPRWLRWLGVIAVGLMPFSAIVFIPIVLLPLWVFCLSIWMFREGPETATL